MPVDPSTAFSWLHLSDVHYGHFSRNHRNDQQIVQARLLADIERQAAKHQLRAIFLTGDIAFSGGGADGSEYGHADEFLAKLLDRTGVAPESVFIVPGNHDVAWNGDREKRTRRLLAGLRAGEIDLDDALADEEDREVIRRRFSSYLEFASKYGPRASERPVEDSTPAPRPASLWWREDIVMGSGHRLRLVGLNSALLASGSDEQKLRLGSTQLSELLGEPAAEDEVVIVLSHHPLSPLWLADEPVYGSLVRGTAHVHIHGHIHENDAVALRAANGRGLVTISGSAMHRDQGEKPAAAYQGYSFGTLNTTPDGLAVRVWHRRYGARDHRFAPDIERVIAGREYCEHILIDAPRTDRGRLSLTRLREIVRPRRLKELPESIASKVAAQSAVGRRPHALALMLQSMANVMIASDRLLQQDVRGSLHQLTNAKTLATRAVSSMWEASSP